MTPLQRCFAKPLLCAGVFALGLLGMAAPAAAQQLILDEEFEQACQKLVAPLRATLASGTSVHFVLVAEDSINAFVDEENIVHVNSGLVLKAKSAAELQGVLAHELGHVTARHIFQKEDDIKNAQMGSLAGAALGLGAAAAGAPQAGVAIAMSSQAGAISNILAHSRTQEAEADRLAINALHTAGLSAKGMVEMFTTLRTESQLSYNAPPPWLVTHPLPPERLETLQHAVQNETAAEATGLAKVNTFDFRRLQAKVFALTNTPAATGRRYMRPDFAARYARALAYIKGGDFDNAESSLEPLLRRFPADPFYQEALGQIALQRGDLGKANIIYSRLLAHQPGAILFRLQLADILRSQNAFAEALVHYRRVVQMWPEWDEPWYGLGLTYGSLGRLAESHLALTEANLIEGDTPAAKQSLQLANHYIKDDPQTPADVKNWASTLEDKLKEAKDERR